MSLHLTLRGWDSVEFTEDAALTVTATEDGHVAQFTLAAPEGAALSLELDAPGDPERLAITAGQPEPKEG